MSVLHGYLELLGIAQIVFLLTPTSLSSILDVLRSAHRRTFIDLGFGERKSYQKKNRV